MYFNVIESGSKGNATLVVENKTVILIDMGVSLLSLVNGLKELNLSINDIDAVIVTHDHSDHISGLKFLSPKIMYALEGTLSSTLSNVVELNIPFSIKDITITPFKTSHDATNPCGYVLKSQNEKLVYMTDTGKFFDENFELVNNPNYLIIESNHDIQMLMNTNRPYELKARILSDVGHLCNEESALISSNIIGNNTKEIVLAHISEEANTPKKALEIYNIIFKKNNIDLSLLNIRVANQHHSLIGGRYEN